MKANVAKSMCVAVVVFSAVASPARAEIAVYQGGAWSDDSNADLAWEPGTDARYNFGGSPGDVPVVYDHQLENPQIAIFNGGYWSIDSNRNGVWNGTGGGDTQIKFGNPGDTPLTPSTFFDSHTWVVGVYNGGVWSIDANADNTFDAGDVQFTFGGSPGDIPVVGNWSGAGTGKVCAGIYNNGVWSLDYNCNEVWDGPGGGDVQFTFGGSPGDMPVVGTWSSSQTCVGVFNGGVWSIDKNCDEVWEGPTGGDEQWTFGSSGDTPLVDSGLVTSGGVHLQ